MIGPLVVLVLVLAVPVGLAVTSTVHLRHLGGFIWGPVLLLLTLPVCRWVAKRTGEPEVCRFLFGAALLK